MTRTGRYSPEVRKRAVRMVFENEREYSSQWPAIVSIASKIGCTPETLRKWSRRTDGESGAVHGTTTAAVDAPRLPA
jgi:transposase